MIIRGVKSLGIAKGEQYKPRISAINDKLSATNISLISFARADFAVRCGTLNERPGKRKEVEK